MTPLDRAADAVRDLFGGCQSPRMGATLDPYPCRSCDGCTRDWTPEARLILEAAGAL